MLQALEARREYSTQKLAELRERLVPAEAIARGKACVYVTGSFGRGEACEHSDLDLFIVGRTTTDDEKKRLLSNLDEICLKAQLIHTVRELHFPEFSGDGEYLEHYTVEQLVRSLGTPEDDASNTFTARLLLLLESSPLVGEDVYRRAIYDVIAAYWRDYPTHQGEFLPAFLANDVLRLWRTFCVNYEARTQTEPDARRRKRRLKNYKLKHSRLLTCYSALLYLMAIWCRNQSVSPEDAVAMVRLTPTQRIEHMQAMPHLQESVAQLTQVLDRYAVFLDRSNAPEADLLRQVGDKRAKDEMFASARDFSQAMFDAMNIIGAGGPFHRMLTV